MQAELGGARVDVRTEVVSPTDHAMIISAARNWLLFTVHSQAIRNTVSTRLVLNLTSIGIRVTST